MSYHIVWMAAAEQALADAYMAARLTADAVAFNEGIREAEHRLTADPEGAGESREAGTGKRLLIEPPAVIEFEVFPVDRVAVVSHVRYTPPRRR
jgi:hypothetical protein